MNSNVNHSIITMESDELRELVTEVKETIATNVQQKQTFSAADLWNIQKNMKSAQRVARRNLVAY
jgi:hypothetical protein